MITDERRKRIEKAIEALKIDPDNERAFSTTMEMLDSLTTEELEEYEGDLLEQLADANSNLGAVYSKLATLHIAAGNVVPSTAPLPAVVAGGPVGERIVAGLLLLQAAHESVPVDERTVARSLNPMHRPDFADYREVNASAVGLLRTASYYVLDSRDSAAAIASEPPTEETFPPLPFPRVWIEAHMPGQTKATPYVRFVHDDEDDKERVLDVLGVGLVEVERSRTWDIYIAFIKEEIPYFAAMRITPSGFVSSESDQDYDKVAAGGFAAIWNLAVGSAHLITAKNVPHEDIALPRHQRRRLRDAIPSLPRLYYVNLHAAGEHDDHESGRTYTVRWLVRGHWRHIETGQTLCTCHRPGRVATWIDPYIKGAVGAPWKGRPVHRAAHVEHAAA